MKRFILAFTALVGIGSAIAVADYTATQGAGTTFGSGVVATIHYAKMMLCDLTAPATQCATVSAAGAVKVDGSAVTQPVSLASTTVTGTVTANAGTNLNTSALALDATLATTNTDLGPPGATACSSDTASCSLNALAQRQAQRLTTINTTLGTPFQAGGSIGNTTFAATQATASNFNATVVGTGTFAVQCSNCSGSGVSTADKAAFTAGTSLFVGTGGFFQTTATANPLTDGQQGMQQMTNTRAGFVNLRNAAGAELGVAAAPLQVSVANTAANGTAMLVTGTGGTFPVTGTVTANAGTNLNTSALALDATLATTNTDLGPPGATACATDTGSCSLNALAQRQAQRLTTINTTLGTPFQAGGSIGNTTFAATQGTSPWVVTGTGGAFPIATWAGGTLGAMANYGTSPGAVLVPGTNAFVTNTVTVSATNLSTNIAQMNGVGVLMDNGATGTGAQRISISNNTSAIANWGHVATGAAPPANTQYIGANTSGATGGLVQGLIQCDSKAIYDASTNGSTELVPLTTGRTIYVCGYTIMSSGTVNVKLIYGTSTNCVTGPTSMTPAWQLTTQVGLVDGSPFARGLKTASANALCINTSAGISVQAIVYYAVI